jgi:ankyrin repeat protein
MERLLEAGARIDAKDLKGRTALHLSCARGDMGCIENILLQQGRMDVCMVYPRHNPLDLL